MEESGSAFYTYLSDPVSKNFYRDVFVQKASVFSESDFELFGEEFIRKCNDLKIPLPKNIDPHRLLVFGSTLTLLMDTRIETPDSIGLKEQNSQGFEVLHLPALEVEH